MKKLSLAVLLCSLSVSAFADWRMDRFDVDQDGFVTMAELEMQGCRVRPGLFLAADKNKDEKLSKKELRKASNYIVRRHCPRNEA